MNFLPSTGSLAWSTRPTWGKDTTISIPILTSAAYMTSWENLTILISVRDAKNPRSSQSTTQVASEDKETRMVVSRRNYRRSHSTSSGEVTESPKSSGSVTGHQFISNQSSIEAGINQTCPSRSRPPEIGPYLHQKWQWTNIWNNYQQKETAKSAVVSSAMWRLNHLNIRRRGATSWKTLHHFK